MYSLGDKLRDAAYAERAQQSDQEERTFEELETQVQEHSQSLKQKSLKEDGEPSDQDNEDADSSSPPLAGVNAITSVPVAGKKIDLGAFTRGMFSNFDTPSEREQWSKNTERAARNDKDQKSGQSSPKKKRKKVRQASS